MGVTSSLSDSVFLGQNAGSLESSPALDPITKVILLIDDKNYYEAGTGDNVMEVSCPYGSQQMANDILASLQGYSYQPATAGEALLDPAAEFGDAMTVDGLYTVIANMDLTFDQLMTSDVGAPGEQEIESEYPYQSQQTTESNRNLARVRSLITKTADEITLSVENLEEDMGHTLRVAADGVTITNAQGATVTISGGQIDASTINASQINAANLNLTGVISWGDLNSGVQNQVTSAQNTADTANSTANQVSSEFAQVTQKYGGQTYIDGSMILTDSIYASAIHLGGDLTIYSTQAGNVVGGYMGYTTSNLDGTPGMHMQRGQGEVAVTTNGARMTYGGANNSIYVTNGNAGVFANGTEYQFSPSGFYAYGQPELGSQYALWGQIYSTNSVISTSDRNRKTDVEYDIDERYDKLWSLLKPCTGKFTDGTSGRTHMFLISQDVEEAIEEAGLTSLDFAAFIKSPIEEQGKITEYKYALRYEEFIPLIIHRLQKLEAELEAKA